MNDRKLLEQAAKAAGITWHGDGSDNSDMIVMMPFTRVWNPLENGGDALNLVVRLGLSIDTDRGESSVFEHDLDISCNEPHGSDADAATRRAIVRAAAEIGRNK